MATLSAPTLGKLIASVRSLLGQPNAANSDWTDLDLTNYLNEAVRMYFAEVIQTGEGWFTITDYLSYTANIETVALPVDFFEVKALYIQRTQGWEILPYINNITSGFSTNSGATGDTYTPYYYFQGNNIVLRPVPNGSAADALRLDYVQFPEQMVNGADIAGGTALLNQISPVFKQLIEMYAVYKAKLKQSMVNGTDLTAIPSANLSQIYTTFKGAMGKRSMYPGFTVPFEPEGWGY